MIHAIIRAEIRNSDLAVINPGFISGPLLSTVEGTSVTVRHDYVQI
jgi:hypothetical protein